MYTKHAVNTTTHKYTHNIPHMHRQRERECACVCTFAMEAYTQCDSQAGTQLTTLPHPNTLTKRHTNVRVLSDSQFQSIGSELQWIINCKYSVECEWICFLFNKNSHLPSDDDLMKKCKQFRFVLELDTLTMGAKTGEFMTHWQQQNAFVWHGFLRIVCSNNTWITVLSIKYFVIFEKSLWIQLFF